MNTEDEWKAWWESEGRNAQRLPHHDAVDHLASMTRIAWLNGAFKAADEIERLRGALKHISDAEYADAYSAEFAADVLAGKCEFEDGERMIVSESVLRLEAANNQAKALYWIKEYEEMKKRWLATAPENRRQLEQIAALASENATLGQCVEEMAQRLALAREQIERLGGTT